MYKCLLPLVTICKMRLMPHSRAVRVKLFRL